MNDQAHSTREMIEEAALRLFAMKGYPQTSMEEIAKDVGISKPAIYHHFESKERLFRSILDNARKEQDRIMDEVRAGNLSLHDAIEQLIRRVIQFIREKPDWARLILLIHQIPGDMKNMLDLNRLEEENRAVFIGLVKHSMAGFKLRPGLTMENFADFLMGVFYAFVAKGLLMGETYDMDTTPRVVRDIVLYGSFEKA